MGNRDFSECWKSVAARLFFPGFSDGGKRKPQAPWISWLGMECNVFFSLSTQVPVRFASFKRPKAGSQRPSASLQRGIAGLQHDVTGLHLGLAALQLGVVGLHRGVAGLQFEDAALQQGVAGPQNLVSSPQNGISRFQKEVPNPNLLKIVKS